MEAKCLIYKVTNRINGKCYIGYTNNFTKRRSEHKRAAKINKKYTVFYYAINKYNWINFDWQIIYQSWDEEHCLNIIEPLLIKIFNSMIPNGYNMTEGGDKGPLRFGTDNNGGRKMKGSKFYNNGKIQKMYLPNEIPEGWKEGRLNSAWNKDLDKTDLRVFKNTRNFAQAQKGRIPWNKKEESNEY